MDNARTITIADLVGKKEFREGVFDRASAKAEARTVELAFSSEARFERWFGIEILSHESSAVNLDRIGSGRANVLVNHDPGDWVGVIESARIDADKIGRALIRFGNSARAQEVFKDVQDGILSSVSVGYVIDDMKLTREVKEGPDEYTVTRWTPFEVSLVTVPADASVGVGRSQEQQTEVEVLQPAKATTKGVLKMDEVKTVERSADVEVKAVQQAHTQNTVELEKARVRGIDNICKANKLDPSFREMWVGQGLSMEAVSDDLLKILEERGRTNPQPVTKLGLSANERRTFSLSRAVLAAAEKNWSNAGFELECSRAISAKLDRAPDPNRFYVPFDVMQDNGIAQKRDLTVAAAGAGGYLVGTENQGFIEMLRNRSVAFRMGARRLSGLQGNVTIPRQSAAATAVWLANEASTATESAQTFVQVALTPKTVSAYTELSRQLLLQSSPSAEGIVTDDLAQVVAVAADLAVLNGSGASGQPTGIIGTAGIGGVTGTSLAAAGVIEFMTDVAASNVTPVRPGYVSTPAVAALLMVRPELPGTGTTRLWGGNPWDGSLFGMPAMSSNQMPAANMLFGDWQEVVVAEWGILEVMVNPYANFQAGIIGVRALYSLDVGVRRPFAFSLATSIT